MIVDSFELYQAPLALWLFWLLHDILFDWFNNSVWVYTGVHVKNVLILVTSTYKHLDFDHKGN